MLNWSSPLRRVGSRTLEPIPLEIYQEFFEYLSGNDELSARELRENLANLALVCRFFSALALPRLFAKVEFSGNSSGPDVARTNRFCRALNNGQEPAKSLSQYVKTCTFTSWDWEGPLAGSRDAFLTMYCNALSKMTSVEVLVFSSVIIDRRIIKAMQSLPALDSLVFSRSLLKQGCDHNRIVAVLQKLRLRSLVIGVWSSPALQNIITPALSLRDLIKLEVDSWTMIQRLSELDISCPLQILTIHSVEDPTLLPKLFQKTPELKHLHVYTMRGRTESLDFIELPGTLLSNLSFFDGPASLAMVVIPFRPIQKVWLMGTLTGLRGQRERAAIPELQPLTQRIWEVLAKSRVPVTDLLIPQHLYHVVSLKSFLPRVTTLRVSWCHANFWELDQLPRCASEKEIRQAVTKLCRKWPPNSSIRQLVFELSLEDTEDATLLNLQLQFELLEDIVSKAFPSVEQVNFITCVDWRRSVGGTWRPVIPKAKKRYLWLRWNDYDQFALVDYGGCYEALFDPNSPDFRDYAEA
ncbi:hypothetical protein NP233_g3141 [Leucocoprinus birnbaumii]|uniref:F-box domain-containing protein n=1 Tax=Leucocoprinus birnbaumii TaxID=56174 RepID=A0AAD5W3I0_9AGAR|nr:hypothetical protein NP233_g3141 [Leucocoprinus birnbaumii]